MATQQTLSLLQMLYSFLIYSLLYNDKAYHNNCIVAFILNHTNLSVCSVLLTFRASPTAIPPLSLILFPSSLFLNTKNLSYIYYLKTAINKSVHGQIIVIVIVKFEGMNIR